MGEEAIILKDNNVWEIRKLKRFGNLLIDRMNGKAYAVDGNKITIKKGMKSKSYYLIDEEKGVSLAAEILRAMERGDDELKVNPPSIRIEKDETVIKLKTNPELTYQLIEGGLLLKLLRIKPTMSQVVAGIILGMIIGFFVGGILF